MQKSPATLYATVLTLHISREIDMNRVFIKQKTKKNVHNN